MSAKDDLDRLERDWGNHIEWRKGKRLMMSADPPGKYVGTENCGWDWKLSLRELPERVRSAFLKDAEAIIGAALDAKYQAIHRDMRKAAREEAERTLNELREST